MAPLNIDIFSSFSTIATSLGTLFAVYVIYAVVVAWLQPYRTPLAALQGPPIKHWYFGFRTFAETKQAQLVQAAIKNTEEYGDAHYAVMNNRYPVLFLADQVAVNHVMLSASRTFTKTPQGMRTLQTFFGEGLLAVDGEVHKLHRKVAFPAFTNRAVEEMSPIFFNSGQKLLDRWNRKYGSSLDDNQGVAINAFDEFTLVALDVIGRAGFNYDFKSLNDEETSLGLAFETIFKKLLSTTLYALLRMNFPSLGEIGKLFVIEQNELDNARLVVKRTSHELVDEAKARVREETAGEIKSDDVEGKDLLSLMVRSNMSVDTKVSEKMQDKDMIAMVPTFLAAGHETTSSALSWVAYALSRPGSTDMMNGNGIDKQTRLREELLDANYDGWQSDYKNLDSLPYLDAVIKEVLRLFAPVRSTARMATQDDVIPLDQPIQLKNGSTTKSIHIAKGDGVIIQIWRLNTDKRIWGDDAMTFRPERWLEKDHKYLDGGLTALAKKNHGWSRLATFTVGPRNCIGMHMAIAEMKVLIAMMLSNFELRPIELPGQETVEIDWKNVIVTRPFRKGVPGKLDMPCRIVRIKQ